MPKKRLRRFALVGLLAVLAIGCVFLLRRALPWTVKSRLERVFVHGSLLDKRLGYLASGESVFIQAEDLTLAGELYEPPGLSPPHPAILLVHGSTRSGRRLALYPLLAEGLTRKGYLVLAFDLRGFGDSQTPADVNSVEAWDSTEDISAALTFLESLDKVDGELESEASKTYLEEQYGQMTDPKSFVRLQDAAHYLSVTGLEELHRLPGVGNLVVYDRRTMKVALAAIDDFLSE